MSRRASGLDQSLPKREVHVTSAFVQAPIADEASAAILSSILGHSCGAAHGCASNRAAFQRCASIFQRPENLAGRFSMKLRTPSVASSDACSRRRSFCNCAAATFGPSNTAFRALARVAATARGACWLIRVAISIARCALTPGRDHFLDEP